MDVRESMLVQLNNTILIPRNYMFRLTLKPATWTDRACIYGVCFHYTGNHTRTLQPRVVCKYAMYVTAELFGKHRTFGERMFVIFKHGYINHPIFIKRMRAGSRIWCTRSHIIMNGMRYGAAVFSHC